MRSWVRVVLAIISVVVAALVVTAVWGPNFVRNHAQEWVRIETGRSLSIGNISINLLALSLDVRDVTLTEIDQTRPFISWSRLYVALSPRSLWHRAPIVRELECDNPIFHIDRDKDGRFNFSDLLDKGTQETSPGAEDTGPIRFSLNNLVVHGGRIEVVDQTLDPPATHVVDNLELAIPFVGNLPYLADRYVMPLLQARINGTPIELKGELKPFADIQEYVVKLKLDGVDLPYYLGYLPKPLPFTVRSGRIDLDFDFAYRASASAIPQMELSGRFDLTTLDLRERDGRPLLFLPLLEARLMASHPLDHEFHLGTLSVNNLQAWIDRDQDGSWNVVEMFDTLAPSTAKPAHLVKKPALPQLKIDQLRLRNGQLGVRDNLPTGGFATTVKNIDLTVIDFTLADPTPFRISLDFVSERREQAHLDGQATVSPFTCDLEIAATGIPLAPYAPYYQGLYATSLEGGIDAKAHLVISPEHQLLIKGGRLEGHGIVIPFSPNGGLKMPRLLYDGINFNLDANRLEIADIVLDGADLNFSRSRQGLWSFHSGNFPFLAKLAEPTRTSIRPASPQPPFNYHIGKIAVHNAKITVRDELPTKPANFMISGLKAVVRNLEAPEKIQASINVEGDVDKKGRFLLNGMAIPATPELRATVQLKRIPMLNFAPYLEDWFRIVLVDGMIDSNVDAKFSRHNEAWRGQISGNLDINRFYCLDADHREDLLRWERLQVKGIDAQVAPLALDITSVSLNNYYARVLLDERARLNLAEIFAGPSTTSSPGPVPGGRQEPISAPPKPPASPAMNAHVGNITLQGGRVNFTDRHMPQQFTADMLELGGRIEGLSSAPGSRAEIDLRGRLRNESPLRVTGTVNPLAQPLFLDLTLDFKNIELSPLSPYSGTYLGYLIERGKLNVTLNYLVEEGRLTATNKIFLDQFTFGDKVASDSATSLPVRLAVSLLKDRNGEIHLDIPVSGNIDDPQFSVIGIIWQIIKNLLTKAVTSPLALLGALSGSGENFSAIVFPYGSAEPSESEQAKLAQIAEALRDRKELKIDVKGYVDPDNDPEAYRRTLLLERIKREKLLDLSEHQGEAAVPDVATVVVTSEEYPEYLWRVYKAADFPKPTNFFGWVKHLPDPELEKLLLANIKVGKQELDALAQSRAEAVVSALVESGGISPDRVYLTTADITAKPTDEAIRRSRVEFGLEVK